MKTKPPAVLLRYAIAYRGRNGRWYLGGKVYDYHAEAAKEVRRDGRLPHAPASRVVRVFVVVDHAQWSRMAPERRWEW